MGKRKKKNKSRKKKDDSDSEEWTPNNVYNYESDENYYSEVSDDLENEKSDEEYEISKTKTKIFHLFTNSRSKSIS